MPVHKSVPLQFSEYTYNISIYSVHIHTMLPVYLLLKGVVQDLRGIACTMKIYQNYFEIIFTSQNMVAKTKEKGQMVSRNSHLPKQQLC